MKDDKKKVMVLGALFAVLLGVGAFSFLGGGSTPPPTATAKKEDAAKDGKTAKVDAEGNPLPGAEVEEAPNNPLYAAELPQRDPFASRPLPGEAAPPTSQPLPQPTPPPVKRSSGGSRRSSGGGSGYTPYMPPPLSGSLPNPSGGNVSISPTGPDTSSFGYTVSGTMTGGSRRVAVFTDSSGNQRMVPEGGSLDGDSKVVAIEKGSVTIEHRGKKQRLSLGGNPK